MSWEKVEYWEAQVRSKNNGEWSKWCRLGGKTIDGAREAIENSKKSAQVMRRFVGGNDATEYRIRHFVGEVEDTPIN